jgi:hypothetical protein
MGSIYKMIEVVGTSEKSYAEATREAIREASKTVQDISWFQVVELRGSVSNGELKEFQAIVKVGFKVAR